ncbi:cytochrome P450 [Gymnopus androsaceus JB14]|uniref:Cytochrome P450 n=1 Tax=Gymnopus androsaceus JB14 TaxID=1447944 RepID=A0A6A4GXJ8_9AGAR|nr:cytochrome P450 [Gymnopus androsaceus JB14]
MYNSTAYLNHSTAVATMLIRYSTSQVNGLKLPPGPTPSFFVGNMHDIPIAQEWNTFTKWTKQFGDIVYLRVLGTKMLLLGSYRVANELIVKRGAIYSDRPITSPMLEMETMLTIVFRRRLFEQHLRYSVVDRHQPIQIPPDNCTIGAIILDIVYGYRVTSERDPWVEVGEQSGRYFEKCAKPGAWAVDVLPFLRYVPTWFPFTEWKVFALESSAHRTYRVNDMFKMVQAAMKEGTANPSMVLRYLEENKNGADIPEEAIMDMASAAYGAGVQTMTKHRSIQRKAQEELDRVCPDRLPTFDDRKNLHYIEAIGMEVGRWHPGVPQGIAHRLEKDDSFEGKFLPKGSLIIPNIWGMCHDEETYRSPDVFDPDRFINAKGDGLDTSVLDPRQMIFGFGRRQCPGRPFAESQFFYTMALILKVFDVLPPLDTQGKEVIQPEVYRSGIVSLPMSFSCRIIPRSNDMAELIRRTEHE